mmetsp:Transcript_104696/g.265817  ORF Transcript_104696/g.265817 Transcript_104696/m.265817 type:complete len:207 (-) Transcript_104696:526-1146(-)
MAPVCPHGRVCNRKAPSIPLGLPKCPQSMTCESWIQLWPPCVSPRAFTKERRSASTCATPGGSAEFAAQCQHAFSLTVGMALPIATPIFTACSISTSFSASPNAIASDSVLSNSFSAASRPSALLQSGWSKVRQVGSALTNFTRPPARASRRSRPASKSSRLPMKWSRCGSSRRGAFCGGSVPPEAPRNAEMAASYPPRLDGSGSP